MSKKIIFIKSKTCGPCKSLDRVFDEWGDGKPVVHTVYIEDGLKTLDLDGFTYNVQCKAVPELMFIDNNGNVKKWTVGFKLKKEIEDIYNEL